MGFTGGGVGRAVVSGSNGAGVVVVCLSFFGGAFVPCSCV